MSKEISREQIDTVMRNLGPVFRPFCTAIENAKRYYNIRFIRKELNEEFKNIKVVDGVARVLPPNENVWLDQHLYNYLTEKDNRSLNLVRLYKEFILDTGLSLSSRDETLTIGGFILSVKVIKHVIKQNKETDNVLEGAIASLISVYHAMGAKPDVLVKLLDNIEDWLIKGVELKVPKIYTYADVADENGRRYDLVSPAFDSVSASGLRFGMTLMSKGPINNEDEDTYSDYYHNLSVNYNTVLRNGKDAYTELSLIGAYIPHFNYLK